MTTIEQAALKGHEAYEAAEFRKHVAFAQAVVRFIAENPSDGMVEAAGMAGGIAQLNEVGRAHYLGVVSAALMALVWALALGNLIAGDKNTFWMLIGFSAVCMTLGTMEEK